MMGHLAADHSRGAPALQHVSCPSGGRQAAALATLDVIEHDGMVARAAALGGSLRRRLAALAARHPGIGEVRGLGLMLGVELVRVARHAGAGPRRCSAGW
ncbi:MAG: aminotransferase class III-fold pyridoxal phosphate-dependent enzyme [Dehalococcoidia bacterium]